MHRNTYVVVSILAVLAALVVGVNVGKKISPAPTEPSPVTPTLAPSPEPQFQTYVNTICGFSIQYGNEFSLSDNASGSAILATGDDQSTSIAMTCQKNIPRPPIPADKMESRTFTTTTGASTSATLYHDESAKDGTPMDALIFTHPTRKLDIFIAGYGTAFNALIKTIQILP